ncbi:DUF3124 domain-containing protein [Calothrix sp. FACHB-1219]|uniref:DUF3124 domain-containing protein n=1 Tax=unclassified Calothrix TaxID=2619626 RepID=UPI001687330D|nr:MULTISPECIES: DUF3124 domain-containing protein [unclassified Calothrix]MBD2205763.1 DUF3124 domain-containing protein [Calothrix sp. FACHB-168]MBD2220592.1 DUF3124 domain-containing protein [Calothrix sp. FACHB-1219]
MKLYIRFYLIAAVLIFLVACTSPNKQQNSQSLNNKTTSSQQVVTLDKNFPVAMGQTIYVPIYSHIYHGDEPQLLNLAATLSIRNTDLTNPLIITAVRYYDSDGALIRQYLDQPIQLKALGSTEFFINKRDTSGGIGANFIVEWVSAKVISEPIVEAVMIATEFQQGVSFVSTGKVIKNVKNSQNTSVK